MVRFKVIKGSHLLLAIAVLLLAVVIGFILLRSGNSSANPDAQGYPNAQITQNMEAKALEAFASKTIAQLEIEIIPDIVQVQSVQQSDRSILIYHTHTHEAYEQDTDDPYEAVETWRTLDMEHSVVRLGRALSEELRSMGYEVVHDTTDHEQNSLSDSYVRSLHTLENYDRDFDLCIDLHRDAYADGLETCLIADGEEYAQIMLLVGRGDNYDAGEKPDYQSNLNFAQRLTSAMNVNIPGICRNVTVKTGRYNQHIGGRNILVEVGHNKNTLQQALNSIPCLAESINSTMRQIR